MIELAKLNGTEREVYDAEAARLASLALAAQYAREYLDQIQAEAEAPRCSAMIADAMGRLSIKMKALYRMATEEADSETWTWMIQNGYNGKGVLMRAGRMYG